MTVIHRKNAPSNPLKATEPGVKYVKKRVFVCAHVCLWRHKSVYLGMFVCGGMCMFECAHPCLCVQIGVCVFDSNQIPL